MKRITWHGCSLFLLALFALSYVQQRSPVTTADTGGQPYTVKAGETLPTIAKSVWNDASAWPVIWIATNARSEIDTSVSGIPDARSLKAGQVLWIPDDRTSAVAPEILALQAHGITNMSPRKILDVPDLLNSYDALLFDELRLDYSPPFVADPPVEHPEGMASLGTFMVHQYFEYDDDPKRVQYLNSAKKLADLLIDNQILMNGGAMYPYRIPQKQYEIPWYSGLAQGEALALMSQFYKATGNAKYLDAAKRTFKTFSIFRPQPYVSDNWVSNVDENGYYWIEEYPRDYPDHTLNGFQYAVVGLHKYYMITRDPAARFLLQAALATMSHYAEQNLNPGWISDKRLLDGLGERHKLYSMKYSYHLMHIQLLRQAYLMNNDPDLYRIAQEYEWDRVIIDRIRATVGSLSVTINPPEAAAAGALWRRHTTDQRSSMADYFDPRDWYASQAVEPQVVPNTYMLEFKTIPGWDAPAPVDIRVSSYVTTTVEVTYVRNYLATTMSADDRDQWITYYQQRVSQNSDDGAAYLALGQLYQGGGNTAQAEASYLQAIATSWQSHLPRLYLARLYVALRKWPQATDLLKEVVAGCPRCWSVFAELGGVYRTTKQTDAAIEAYRASVVGTPGTVEYDWLTFRLLNSKGYTAAANDAANAVIAETDLVTSPSEDLRMLADIQLRLGREDEAIAAYQAALSKAPRDTESIIALLKLYIQRDTKPEAQAVCDHGLHLRPVNSTVVSLCQSLQ